MLQTKIVSSYVHVARFAAHVALVARHHVTNDICICQSIGNKCNQLMYWIWFASLLPVLLFAADDVDVVVVGGTGTVTVGCCDCCCCRLLLLLLCKRQNVSHLATCLARQWMSNILDRCKCQRLTGNTSTHTATHIRLHTHLAHFAAVALVLVMLPATCCCQRPDWPGKRQIRRTIALDFYLSNVYGPLAGQAVAQSSALADSQRLQKNTTHTTLQYSASPFAYSLIKQFFSQFCSAATFFMISN